MTLGAAMFFSPFARAVGVGPQSAGPSTSGSSTVASTSLAVDSYGNPATMTAGLSSFPATVHAGFSGLETRTASNAGAHAPPLGVATGIRVTGAPDKPAPRPCGGGFGLQMCLGVGAGAQVSAAGGPSATTEITFEPTPAPPSSSSSTGRAAAGPALAAAPTPAAAQERLAEAVLNGTAAELQAALADAQRAGLQGHEVRRAKDALLAAEASDTRKRTELSVEEAIELDDWWKLQAAMQAVVGAGFGESEMVVRLREAMRTHSRRREVVQEIKRSAAARDAPRLRTALEAALLTHAREPDVRRAREALQALHLRAAAKEELKRALASKDADVQPLQEALAAAERAGLGEKAPEPLGEDPEEKATVEAVREELRSRAIAKLEGLHVKRDAAGLTAALGDAGGWGVDEAKVAIFNERLSQLHNQEKSRQELRDALQDGSKDRLSAAVEAAAAVGITPAGAHDEDAELLRRVEEAIRQCDEREHRACTVATAAAELRAAAAGDDVHRLAKALSAAEAAGVGVTAEMAGARERLRLLRARACAAQDLKEAVQAANVYRLRAAMAGARGMGLPEKDVTAAREALKSLEAKARTSRGLGGGSGGGGGASVASAAAWPSSSSREAAPSAADAGARGVSSGSRPQPRREGGGAAAAAGALAAEHAEKLLQELRDVLADPVADPQRLRAAARAAADAGAAGSGEVADAWERLRVAETGEWLRRQLKAALASGSAVQLRAAVKQAEAAGEDGSLAADLAKARAELNACSEREHARQGLRLARASSNPQSLLAAVRAAEQAGLPAWEFEGDAAACKGVELVEPPSPPRAGGAGAQEKRPRPGREAGPDTPRFGGQPGGGGGEPGGVGGTSLPTLLGSSSPAPAAPAMAAAPPPQGGCPRRAGGVVGGGEKAPPSPPPPRRRAASSGRRVRFADEEN